MGLPELEAQLRLAAKRSRGPPGLPGYPGRSPGRSGPSEAPRRPMVGPGRCLAGPKGARPETPTHRARTVEGHCTQGRRPPHTGGTAAGRSTQGAGPKAFHTRPTAASHKAKGRLTHWPLGEGPVHKTRRVVHCTGSCKPRAAFYHIGASTAHLIRAHIWQTTQHTHAHEAGPVTQAPRHAHTAGVGVSASPHSTTRTAGPGTQRSTLHMTPLAV